MVQPKICANKNCNNEASDECIYHKCVDCCLEEDQCRRFDHDW